MSWSIRVGSVVSTFAPYGAGRARAMPATPEATAPTDAERAAARRLRAVLDDLVTELPRTIPTRAAQAYVAPTPGSPAVPEVPAVPATVQSSQDVVLLATPSEAHFHATAQVNTANTSYSTKGPAWSTTAATPGTSVPTIGGVYAGTYSGSLRFQVRQNGVVGASLVSVRVYDSNNNQVDSFNLRPGQAPGTQRTLANGLRVSFSAGNLRANSEFSINVSSTTPTSVDVTKPMNGTRADSAWLDEGVTVTNGAFRVNGVLISVAASDSIQDVLDRITASAAGVTGVYDPATDQVSLRQKTEGSVPTITLGTDTSGFLAAVKLTGGTLTPGTDGGSSPAADMHHYDAFAGVTAGTVRVNGVSIAVDPATESLLDVLDAIQTSAAGVDAAWNDTTKRVVLTSRDASAPLEVDDNGTGFFDAVFVTSDTYTGTPAVPEQPEVPADPGQAAVRGGPRFRAIGVGARLEAIVDAFNALGEGALRTALAESLTAALGDELDTGFGLRFDNADGQLTARFGTTGRRALGRAMRTRYAAMRATLDAPQATLDGRSLLGSLRATLQAFEGTGQP
jgi:hypothetical protein